MGDFMRLRLKYVSADIDRHGNVRYYVRRPGQPKSRLHGMPGGEQFMAEYQMALESNADGPRQARAARRGSSRHLCQLFYASADFMGLDASTRSWERSALDSICQ